MCAATAFIFDSCESVEGFWDRKCIDLRENSISQRSDSDCLRIAECSNHLSYQGQTFAVPCFLILALDETIGSFIHNSSNNDGRKWKYIWPKSLGTQAFWNEGILQKSIFPNNNYHTDCVSHWHVFLYAILNCQPFLYIVSTWSSVSKCAIFVVFFAWGKFWLRLRSPGNIISIIPPFFEASNNMWVKFD